MSSTPQETRPTEPGSSHRAGATAQLVSFHLAREVYGIEITKVREIILMGEITRVPDTAPYVKGLVNLRSTVIPVIDLRVRFGLPESESTQDSRIVVVQANGKTIGVIVDAVSEVIRVARDQIAPPPRAVVSPANEYLLGVVKLDGRLLILLDIDRILGPEEAAALDKAAQLE